MSWRDEVYIWVISLCHDVGGSIRDCVMEMMMKGLAYG